MTENVWVGLIGSVIGGAITILSSFVTGLLKERSDSKARWQEHQFRIEAQEQERRFNLDDKEREKKKAIEDEISNEDKFWFDNALKFRVLQTKIFTARSREELEQADVNIATFLEETPEYLLTGDNLAFFYMYCTSSFRERHPELKADNPVLQGFVQRLRDFKIPSGEDIRKAQTARSDINVL